MVFYLFKMAKSRVLALATRMMSSFAQKLNSRFAAMRECICVVFRIHLNLLVFFMVRHKSVLNLETRKLVFVQSVRRTTAAAQCMI